MGLTFFQILGITALCIVINNAQFSYLNPSITPAMTCQAFPLSLESSSSPVLSIVRLSYQFVSVISLFALLAVKIYFLIILLYSLGNESAK